MPRVKITMFSPDYPFVVMASFYWSVRNLKPQGNHEIVVHVSHARNTQMQWYNTSLIPQNISLFQIKELRMSDTYMWNRISHLNGATAKKFIFIRDNVTFCVVSKYPF